MGFGRKGKLYVRFFLAVALPASVLASYYAFASTPTATPLFFVQNGSFNHNASSSPADQQLFFYSNFSSTNLSFEENNTFKFFKRTLYQPQNRSLVGYWKLDGNAEDGESDLL